MPGKICLVGVDENGYGPVLGPLVVSAASVAAPAPAAGPFAPAPETILRRHDLWPLLDDAGAAGVRDSKLVFRPGGRGREKLEDIVLAFFRCAEGFLPGSSASFLGRVLANGPAGLLFPCPGEQVRAMCLRDRALEISPARARGINALAGRVAAAAAASGLGGLRVRCLVFCPSLCNRAGRCPAAPAWLAGADNKAGLVARGGLRLVTAAAEGEGFVAAAGKIGGMRRYRAHLAAFFPEGGISPGAEEPAFSHYALAAPGAAGEIAYLRDAEDKSFLVALASLFGKYTREIFMENINDCLADACPGPRRASGYRDPVTAGFIRRTASARAEMNIPDRCFFRP